MGQADAMLIVGPERSVLVDCGTPRKGDKDGYKRVVKSIEESLGRKHVDAPLLTHFHSDHVGEPPIPGKGPHARPGTGVWGLFEQGVTVTAIIDHGDERPPFAVESGEHKLFRLALPKWLKASAFSERRVPKVGEELDLGGGAKIKFVSVNGNGALEKAAKAGRFADGVIPSENDYSISFVASLGNFEFFSGGDLSGADTPPREPGDKDLDDDRDSYTDVETTVAPTIGNVEVLRANHHGSSHSTNKAFVSTLKPEVSIISCGAGNPYQHPAPDVVDRLRACGPVFVTSGVARDWPGRKGPVVAGETTITVAADGKSYLVTGKDGVLVQGRSYSDAEEARGLDRSRAGR